MTAEVSLDGADREDRLASALSGIRTRASADSVERYIHLAGPVLMPLGAAVIVLGWWGAANTTRVFLQIPYLISGGLLGLSLVFAGGFFYFARWVTDLVAETKAVSDAARAQTQEVVGALERIERLLAQSNELWIEDGSTDGVASTAVISGVVATAAGKLYHRADCSMVSGRDVRDASSEVGDLAPCKICEPDAG